MVRFHHVWWRKISVRYREACVECMGDEGEFFVAELCRGFLLFRSQSCLHSSSRLRPLFVSRHRPSPVVQWGRSRNRGKAVNQLLVGVHATARCRRRLGRAGSDLGPGSKLLPLLAASGAVSRPRAQRCCHCVGRRRLGVAGSGVERRPTTQLSERHGDHHRRRDE